jgi:hypothetical protein
VASSVMRTIIVKAAPRFATILCLCYVRHIRLTWPLGMAHTAGWAALIRVSTVQ